jgi:hypothetical protein
MGKFHPVVLDDPPPPRRHVRRTVFTVLLAMMIAPLIVEGSLLCAARWRSMRGTEVIYVETPVMNALGTGYADLSSAIRRRTSRWFRDPAWRPGRTIGVAVAWALGASILLRGMRR